MQLGSRILVVVIALSLLLSACASQPAAPTAAPTAAPKAAAPTAAAPAAAPTTAPTAAPQAAVPTAAPKPAATAAPATNYPEKPVTAIVPYNAGGPIDGIARTMAEAIKGTFPQPLTVINRAGGDGTIGATEVVRAKADGYTIGVTNQESLILQVHRNPLPYKTVDDYQPVINLVTTPSLIVVKADAPYNNLKEFITYAKANPGKIRYGIAGSVSSRLTLADLSKQAGIEVTEVPFEGAAPAVTALLGGHVDAISTVTTVVVGHVSAGTLKVINSYSPQRNPKFPNAPTAREMGFDLLQANYYLAFAPKGTPQPIVQAIHDSFKKGLESDLYQKWVADNNFIVDYLNTADLTARLKKDWDYYSEAIKKLQ